MSISTLWGTPNILQGLGNEAPVVQETALSFSTTYSVGAGGTLFPLTKFPFNCTITSICVSADALPPGPNPAILTLERNTIQIGGLQNITLSPTLTVYTAVPPNTFNAGDQIDLFLITSDGSLSNVNLTLTIYFTKS